MSTGWPSDKKIFFSHPDLLIPPKIHFEETTRIITQSLERAKVYFDLISKTRTQAVPIGVIHGFDEETLLNTYCELKDIGYQHFALGSLSIRFVTNRNICFKTLKIAQRYEIKPLHLFGITWPFNHDNLFWEVDSFDSSAPAKLAFYGTVLYGPPLRRYVIKPTALQRFHDKCFTFRESLSEPLPCNCPICKQNPEYLFLKNDSEAKKSRVIHNYFQIKWEMESRLSHGPGLSS
jgi:tRNA-guanine family transglycosylase